MRGGTGAEVIYALRNSDTLARTVLESIGAEGQTTRKYYQRRLPSDTSKDYYFIHRNTGVTEPIIVEYGFIDDTAENVRFLNDNYKRLAEAVIRAVASYKGFDYTAPEDLMTNTYVVKKGDSLYSIATSYNTTVTELKELNNLTNNTLQIGQILRVPSTEEQTPNENTYTVKQGDSLYSIASQFNTTVDILKQINNLTSNLLSIGQILKLNEETNLDKKNTYTVKKGDNLYSIARQFNTTVDILKQLNNLTSNLLTINQVLQLPTTNQNQTTYTVQKGDNLYSIARQFNTTVATLKQLNNLDSNLLSIGQKLIIK